MLEVLLVSKNPNIKKPPFHTPLHYCPNSSALIHIPITCIWLLLSLISAAFFKLYLFSAMFEHIPYSLLTSMA
jgi:hypothetical protein